MNVFTNGSILVNGGIAQHGDLLGVFHYSPEIPLRAAAAVLIQDRQIFHITSEFENGVVLTSDRRIIAKQKYMRITPSSLEEGIVAIQGKVKRTWDLVRVEHVLEGGTHILSSDGNIYPTNNSTYETFRVVNSPLVGKYIIINSLTKTIGKVAAVFECGSILTDDGIHVERPDAGFSHPSGIQCLRKTIDAIFQK